jgi:hypothetical protein
MEAQHLSVLAGTASSIMFATGTMNMLWKAWRTKDVYSYSIAQLVLNNVGNLVYWLYVASLPFGPIYILHAFYTISTILMLAWCLLYRWRPQTSRHISQTLQRVITQTIEAPQVRTGLN